MGLMDALVGAAGKAAMGALQGQNSSSGSAGGLDPKMLIGVVGALMNNAGGLSGLLGKLQSGGLGEAVQSWVGTGANLPVSGDTLGRALGPDLIGLVAQQLGSNNQDTAGTLANVLPGLIDQLTPKGQLPTDNGMGALSGLLGGGGDQLMGALGSLMGKR